MMAKKKKPTIEEFPKLVIEISEDGIVHFIPAKADDPRLMTVTSSFREELKFDEQGAFIDRWENEKYVYSYRP